MPNLTVTLLPAGAITIGAKWAISGASPSNWYASGATVALAAGDYVLICNYVEGYSTPAATTVTIAAAPVAQTLTYGAVSWLATWAPPISIAYWRGQIFTCGNTDLDADASKVRWSEIGAMRFLGATANPQRNEAGEFSLPNYATKSRNIPLRLLPLRHHMLVYGSGGIYTLKPVDTPVPSFGTGEVEGMCGILNPLAVGGDERKHVFIDSKGNLCMIKSDEYKNVSGTVIGYQDIFADMQDDFSITTGAGLISVVHNPTDDEFYISDGRRSFLFTGDSLTELGNAYTSYINIHSSFIAQTDKNLKAFSGVIDLSLNTYLYVETDIIDFNMSAIKTITGIDIEGSFVTGSVVEVMVKWRNDRTGVFNSTAWKRCSPSGHAAPFVSGSDLRICVRVSTFDEVVINGLMIEWQLSDKNTVRGSYTNVSGITSNAG